MSNNIISSSSTPAAARELSDPNLGECTGSEQSCKDNVAIVGDSSSAHVLDSSIPFEHNAGFNSPPESDIKHDASHVVVHPPAGQHRDAFTNLQFASHDACKFKP